MTRYDVNQDPDLTSNDASFGFRDVPEESKQGLVRGVFDSVADKYDLMNDLMSGGVHRLWKKQMVDWLNPQNGQSFLDVAGGTGDIAFRIADRVAGKSASGSAEITVCDINQNMLSVGRERAGRLTPETQEALRWICGNAETLPMESQSVDAYTIAFGIRNVTHMDAALSEAFRVLKPGGRFLCLEFSTVQVAGLDTLYDRFSFDLVPEIGKWVTGDRDSYQYLVESIRRFPNQAAFKEMIEAAGFSQVKVRNLSGGIAAMHSGWRV